MEGRLEPGSRRIEAGRDFTLSAPAGEPERDVLNEGIAGEIIEAGTTRFLAQCPKARLHTPPAFGAFVRVLPEGSPTPASGPAARQSSDSNDPFADPVLPAPGALPSDVPDGTLYALVCSASTGSAEPGRRPAAYGLDEARLRAEQPQIFDLLATQFAALHIGFADGGRIRAYLPPRPPRLHAFVTECSPAEVCALTDSPDFARFLLTAPGEAGADELIAACLRSAYRCRNADFAFLVRAGKQLASLLREDPERLTALLRKLEP
jgi:hypothetical protein